MCPIECPIQRLKYFLHIQDPFLAGSLCIRIGAVGYSSDLWRTLGLAKIVRNIGKSSSDNFLEKYVTVV